jgi:4-hydroxythreonine-4-phosphate dehydrogenase
MEKPLVAVTIGDPAGVGPEIAVKACTDKAALAAARPVVIGDRSVIEQAVRITGLKARLNGINCSGDARSGLNAASFAPDSLNMIPVDYLGDVPFRFGMVDGRCGKAAFAYIEKAVALARSGTVDAVATAPINKESLRAGGVPYIGHTEIFAALTETHDPLTMFETRGLRIFFLTRHVPLRSACDLVRKARIIDYVERCSAVLKQFGVSDGVMAVAGLNPHSGEHGLFGDEETAEVMPAVEDLRARGFQVEGPVSADSVFHLALQGRYNSVLSLYHDQGHIAAKTLDFERTVAVTGGMPLLRTSVDHGTAFDIAGQNRAGAISMAEAIIVAARYCGKR